MDYYFKYRTISKTVSSTYCYHPWCEWALRMELYRFVVYLSKNITVNVYVIAILREVLTKLEMVLDQQTEILHHRELQQGNIEERLLTLQDLPQLLSLKGKL